jgi:type I restriction enzyme S subunit
MKEGWEYGVLDDAVKKGSSNISLNKIKDDDGDYPVFGAKGFAKNVSFFQQEQEYLAIIKDGAGIGRISKHPAKSSVVATMQYLIPKEGFDISFVQYFLNGIDFQKHRQGSTIPHVYFKDYKSEGFPLLTLPEQQRIVAILDKAFTAIARAKENAQQNLLNAKELFESYLQGVFENKGNDWVEKTLGEVLSSPPKNGWSPPAKFHSASGIPVLTLSAVTGFIFKKDSVKYTSAPVKDDAYYYWLNEGDLLITRSNTPELVGHIAICENLDVKTIYPDLMMKINPNNSIVNTQFLYYQLRSPKLREIITGAAHGANPTMKKVNKQDVQSFEISYPSLLEQQQIVKKLNSLSAETQKLEGIYQQKINDLEELKKSVLNKAFKGEL